MCQHSLVQQGLSWVSEHRVRKTAVAEGLAQRIASGDMPDTIDGKQVRLLFTQGGQHAAQHEQGSHWVSKVGVGKTAVAGGLAQHTPSRDIP